MNAKIGLQFLISVSTVSPRLIGTRILILLHVQVPAVDSFIIINPVKGLLDRFPLSSCLRLRLLVYIYRDICLISWHTFFHRRFLITSIVVRFSSIILNTSSMVLISIQLIFSTTSLGFLKWFFSIIEVGLFKYISNAFINNV